VGVVDGEVERGARLAQESDQPVERLPDRLASVCQEEELGLRNLPCRPSD
jgi:hypothetical protein